MWKEILGFAKQVIDLTKKVDDHEADIKELRQENREIREELKKVIFLLQQLSFDIKHARETEQSEREKLALQLTIKLLEFERHLPSGPKE